MTFYFYLFGVFSLIILFVFLYKRFSSNVEKKKGEELREKLKVETFHDNTTRESFSVDDIDFSETLEEVQQKLFEEKYILKSDDFIKDNPISEQEYLKLLNYFIENFTIIKEPNVIESYLDPLEKSIENISFYEKSNGLNVDDIISINNNTLYYTINISIDREIENTVIEVSELHAVFLIQNYTNSLEILSKKITEINSRFKVEWVPNSKNVIIKTYQEIDFKETVQLIEVIQQYSM